MVNVILNYLPIALFLSNNRPEMYCRGLRESCKINFESHTHAHSMSDLDVFDLVAAALLNLVSMLMNVFLQDSLKPL